MSRVRLLRTTQVVLFSVLLFGCQKKARDEIDFGNFSNSVYKNNYFGMTVAIPSDWSIQDQEAQRRLMKAGSAAVAGDDRNMKALLRASELQTVNLFAAFKHPLGTPVDYNPAVMSMAEMVRQMPGIKRGKDYHFQVRKLLESSQVKVSFPKEIYTEQLGGINFDVMDTEIKVRGVTVKQKYYATIKKGYALCFITAFTTDDEEASLHKILETVKFQ
jgi:hypothetical protein